MYYFKISGVSFTPLYRRPRLNKVYMLQKYLFKRLNVEVPEELMLKIKELAFQENITIRSWITKAIVDKINKDKKYN